MTLSIITLSRSVLSANMLSVVMRSVTFFNAMLCFILPSVALLNVVLLSVMAPSLAQKSLMLILALMRQIGKPKQIQRPSQFPRFGNVGLDKSQSYPRIDDDLSRQRFDAGTGFVRTFKTRAVDQA